MIRKATEYFVAVTGHDLPYNLVWRGASVHTAFDGVWKRFGGWLKRAADSPACELLRLLIQKSTSSAGVWSPYTTLDLWGMVATFRSPETAARKLRSVRYRANQILAPYGVSVSWAGLGVAMSRRRSRGKAARIAAQRTLATILKGRFDIWESNRYGSFSHVEGKRVFFLARGLADTIHDETTSCLGHWVRIGRFASLREALVARETVGFVDGAGGGDTIRHVEGYRWCLRCDGLRRGRVVSNGDLIFNPHGDAPFGHCVKACSCEGVGVTLDVVAPRYAVVRNYEGSADERLLLRWCDDHWDAANWGNRLSTEEQAELEATGRIQQIGRFVSWHEADQFAALMSA